MINEETIISLVRDLIKRYGTRDPFKICVELGIIIMYRDFDDLKGMYKKIGRNRYIVINRNLNKYWQAIICLHELGHDRLHPELGEHAGIRDFEIFQLKEPTELEANMFAAELIYDDEEFLGYIYSGYTVDEIAKITCTCRDLVSIKVNLLRRKGKKNLRMAECDPYFLRSEGAGSDEEDYCAY